MRRSKLLTYCTWLLGCAVVVTGLVAGLDHWGSFFPKRARHRAQMPVDAMAVAPFKDATSSQRGANCICANCADQDDYAGDDPDEDPTDDRLNIWLCDDGGAQKHLQFATAPADELSAILVDNRTSRTPRDEHTALSPSLNSLQVRLQI